MYESLLNAPGSLLAELERMQREMQHAFGSVGRPGSIRAVASGAFPSINVGSTPTTIEIYAFAPGLDPAAVDVQVDRGVLTISGERPAAPTQENETKATYAKERYTGRFKRTVSLPDDADPARVQARYRDGVLRVTVSRKESSQPRRIEIQ